MKKLWLLIIGGVLAAGVVAVLTIGGWLMGTYNGLVAADEGVTGAWSQVETQYQRRFDLIPNLVEATKGILRQEQEVFGAIAEARTHYAGAQPGTTEKVEATNQMESALARLMVIVENYPQLNSNQTVQGLMDELAGTENRIAVVRDRYNQSVRAFNVRVKTFPTSFLAGVFNFEEREFFSSEGGADKAPSADLNLE